MATDARRALGAIAAVAAAALVVFAVTRLPRGHGRGDRDEGRRLFFGELPLDGRIVGQDEPLPQEAVRCANCHEESPRPTPAPSASGPLDNTTTLGPALNRTALTSLAPRRGGPPSSYDAKSFCRVLTEGIDPAHVMIPQTMPRYRVTTDQCEALWTYLTTP
jgi:hypothetical protein